MAAMITIPSCGLMAGTTVLRACPAMIVLKTLNPTYRNTPIACGISAPK
jgi:hypothetical protein